MKKMRKDENCLFCQIVAKKRKAFIIYEDSLTLAFLDIFPVEIGHTLLIPKQHHQNILEIKQNELSALAQTQQKITQLLVTKLKPKGFNFVQNHNKIAGQEIGHYHLHIIPKFLSDKGYNVRHNLPHREEKIEKIWELITE